MHAVTGAVALASALMARGDPEGAHIVLGDAKTFCARSGTDGPLPEIAALCGEAWIDRGRLDEAESVISSALVAARAVDAAQRTLAVSLALGRCLFWQGRYAEAEAVIALPAHVP